MSRFALEHTPLPGLHRVVRQPAGDTRGWFERLFCSEELAAAAGQPFVPVQINRSLTRVRGAVRGLHYQHPPHAEIKYVSCLRGAVFDVAVDLRAGSPTFLRWYGSTLSADNRSSLLIPRGFAHGFQALTEDCELLYLHSDPYHPQAEAGVHPGDPAVGVDWPLPISELSSRDAAHPLLVRDFSGVRDLWA